MTVSQAVQRIALAVNVGIAPVTLLAFAAGDADFVHACATASCIALGAHLGALAYEKTHEKEVRHVG
ncbi:MAG: hypothetical protein ACLRO5_01150 [Collinsella sp.]|uniref:hypothetical protein n=1 Tax=Collinsella sp. TaxID=1965294 RepID=UPI00399074B9